MTGKALQRLQARFRRQTGRYAICLVLVAGSLSSACVRPHPDTTPQAAAIQRANAVIQTLSWLVDVTLAARDINWITDTQSRTILQTISVTNAAIGSAPDGALSTAVAALKALKVQIEAPRLAPYLDWAILTIEGLP